MPKVFRVMKSDEAGLPAIGESSVALSVRIPKDIAPDESGIVHPNTGGMSVSPSIKALFHRLLPTMIPRKYQPLFPKARGSNNTDIWRWGEGDFVKENMNALLQLRPDEHDSTHGVIEPNQSMTLEDYTQALHNTQERWAREEMETL